MERLLVRLPTNHLKYEAVRKKIQQLQAGYAGELYVDRLLHEIPSPSKIIVLSDISLEINPHFRIQIDTLILTPKQIILLEIKNYSGTVHFEEHTGKTKKLSNHGEATEKYDCIIHQLDRTSIGLQTWLQHKGISFPISPIIVMANNQTDIPVFPNTASVKYAKQIPRYIRGILEENVETNVNQFRSIAKLIEANQVKWPYISACKRFDIQPNDLIKGVLCPSCNVPMKRHKGHSWICILCKKSNPLALKKSINDWFLLIDSRISNKQMRDFLDLKSNSSASVIFRTTNMQRHGKAPYTYYTVKTPFYE